MEILEVIKIYKNNMDEAEGLEELTEERIKNILPEEIKIKYEKIKEEKKEREKELEINIKEIRGLIEEEIIKLKRSISYEGLIVSYKKPRTTWDLKKLDLLCLKYKEIEQARKIGKESITIKRIKLNE